MVLYSRNDQLRTRNLDSAARCLSGNGGEDEIKQTMVASLLMRRYSDELMTRSNSTLKTE